MPLGDQLICLFSLLCIRFPTLFSRTLVPAGWLGFFSPACRVFARKRSDPRIPIFCLLMFVRCTGLLQILNVLTPTTTLVWYGMEAMHFLWTLKL